VTEPEGAVSLLTAILDELPVGVIVLDRHRKVVFYNRLEEQLAGRSRQSVLGRDFFTEVAPCLEIREFADEFDNGIGRRRLSGEREATFPFPLAERPRRVLVRLRSFEVAGEPHAYFLLEDVAARRALEQTGEFIASLLAHDLRNPLTALYGTISGLERLTSPLTPADLAAPLAELRTSTDRLRVMVDNFLALTQLQIGVLPVRRTPTDVGRVLGEVAAQLRPAARYYGVALDCRVPDEPAVASADGELLRRAIENLVDNGLRYTPPGSTVTACVVRRADELAIQVCDEGPGVPTDLAARIFEPYVRTGDRSGSHFGLGLAFVRLFAEHHGGRISVHPRRPRGSIFELVLRRIGA
jgi:photoactive yellow protein